MSELKNTFGFTIKNTSLKEEALNEYSYQDILNLMNKKGTVQDVIYEDKTKKGTKARLHIHGVITFDKIPKLTTLLPKGYSTKFEQIYDLYGWNKYCNKNNSQSIYKEPMF